MLTAWVELGHYSWTEKDNRIVHVGFILFSMSILEDQVQEELSRVIGSRQVRVQDRKNLPYADAVIHETQRLANIVPMAIPHITSQDVNFQGFFIRKVWHLVLWKMEIPSSSHSCFNQGCKPFSEMCFFKTDNSHGSCRSAIQILLQGGEGFVVLTCEFPDLKRDCMMEEHCTCICER